MTRERGVHGPGKCDCLAATRAVAGEQTRLMRIDPAPDVAVQARLQIATHLRHMLGEHEITGRQPVADVLLAVAGHITSVLVANTGTFRDPTGHHAIDISDPHVSNVMAQLLMWCVDAMGVVAVELDTEPADT